MSVGISLGTAALISAGVGAAGSITSGIIGSKAAKSAATTQTNAAEQIRQQAIEAGDKATSTVDAATKAANGQLTDANATANTGLADSSATANQTLSDSQAAQLKNLKPYIDSGAISLEQLQGLLGPDGALADPKNQFSFSPSDWQNDPGYAFIKQQQQQAQERSAAANGSLLTGGFAKALNRNQAGLASSYLDSAFNRALQTYQTNRDNTLARVQGLQSLTGLGYNATQNENSTIGNNQGQIANYQLNTGRDIASNNLNTGRQVSANTLNNGLYAGNTGIAASQIAANALGSGAAATAAGTVGSANAWQSALSGVAGATQNAALLYALPQIQLPSKSGPIGNNGIGYNPLGLQPPTQ